MGSALRRTMYVREEIVKEAPDVAQALVEDPRIGKIVFTVP